MDWKQFAVFHSFEAGYLAVLAVLPFIAAIRIVAVTLITFLIFCGIVAVYKKVTKKVIEVQGQAVVISGCDTGFGHALVKRLDYLGFTVIAGCLDDKGEGAEVLRKWSDSGRIHVVQLDVTKEDSIQNVVSYMKKNFGEELWALVNNAAVNFVGDTEFCTMDHYRKIAEVNQFGVIRLTKAFLPFIRKSKGRVINVTSAKGRLCLPSNTVYGSTKYAIEAFSDCLRLEMKKFNVKVIIVEPGDFGGTTGMLSSKTLQWLRKEMDTMWDEASENVRNAYGREYFESIYTGTVSAAKDAAKTTGAVIDAMEDAVTNVFPRIRYLVDGSCKLIDLNNFYIRIRSYIPDSWLDWLMDMTYNRSLPPVAAK